MRLGFDGVTLAKEKGETVERKSERRDGKILTEGTVEQVLVTVLVHDTEVKTVTW